MRLAAVLPTIDEESSLPRVLPRAREIADIVVIADGGSTDRTVEAARDGGARVVESASGRGRQLNAGARAALASGADVLLFVHADTLLPERARRSVEVAIADGAVGGGFEVRFDDPRRIFALGARIVNLRTRLLRAPLGDQAQFATGDAFRAVEGFREWPILEDLDLMRRLRQRGPIAVLRPPAMTAARRFVERGITRTIVTNWSIWALYLLGVDPARLARLYPHIR
ncbi:MAG TPA: TIGR04283 family arsenosugar biosynthesis glycosyltransferase [Thermoanaerobaculia bacterium]|nr:TIGR04283 family arsenosugar biosynthesis glycosyltransferase [Thermoanaerobaculia bacterium]